MSDHEEPLPSFERLVSDLGGRLLGFLRKMLGNDAEDVYQETLMRIAVNLPSLQSRVALKSWAFRIASNAAIDHIRKHQRVDLVELEETARTTESDPIDRLVLDEMNLCVREVIDRLPPTYRAAIVLFNLEGMSVADTAEILHVSPGATKVRLHRARARLEQELGRECSFYTSADGRTRCDRKQPEAPVGPSNNRHRFDMRVCVT